MLPSLTSPLWKYGSEDRIGVFVFNHLSFYSHFQGSKFLFPDSTERERSRIGWIFASSPNVPQGLLTRDLSVCLSVCRSDD